jgi:hypothetical protein
VPPVAAPRGSGAITAIIAGSLGLAIVVSMVMLRGARRQDTVRVAAGSSAVPTFTVEMDITPRTAAVEIDGVSVGVGSGHVSKAFVRDGKSHALRLSAPAHESLLVEFNETSPPPGTIALRPLAPPMPATSAGPSPGPATGVGGTAIPTGAYRVHPPSKVKGSSDARPKTDNINPWE